MTTSCSFAHPYTEHVYLNFGKEWSPEPVHVKVPLRTLFHQSFPEIHELLINGEMIDRKVPDNVIKALIEDRVVICPSAETAQILREYLEHDLQRVPEEASVEISEPRRLRSKKSTSPKSTTSGESDTDDVDMLQRIRRSASKTKPAPIPLENRCHQIILKGDRCGNRVWSLSPSGKFCAVHEPTHPLYTVRKTQPKKSASPGRRRNVRFQAEP